MSPKKTAASGGKDASGGGAKPKKKKSGSSRSAVVVDGMPIGEMSREQVEDLVYRMRAELDRERVARNRAELELSKVTSFWALCRTEANSLNESLIDRDRELEDVAKRHAQEVKEHKQRVKSLLFEQRAAVAEIQEGIAARVATERDEHRQREGELRAENVDLKLAAQLHEVAAHSTLRDASLRHSQDLKNLRRKFEGDVEQVERKWEERYMKLKAEADVQRETELHQLAERKNAQIRILCDRHDRAFAELKTYYDDITLNNLALISALKAELASVKQREEKLEKEAAERAAENKKLAEPLEKARAELAELRGKLSARERDAELVRRADNRAKEAARACDKLRWENEQARRALRKVEKERNELYEKFVQAIADVREKNAQKTLVLERKLASLTAAVESKETQLEEVLRASATPAVAASHAKKVEDVLESKNSTINELRREIAELCVAHNDLLAGDADPKAVPVRPSFA